MSGPQIRLIVGGDPVLVAAAVVAAVDELVGDGDRAELLDERTGEEYSLAEVVMAVATPPMLTPKRIVTARQMSRFVAADLPVLLDYLAAPSPTNDLVLEWDSGRPPKKLVAAVQAAGGVHQSVGVPSGAKHQRNWAEEHFASASLRLDGPARRLVSDHLGADLTRLPSLLAALQAVYGADARLGADDVAPYLGAAGDVPPWALTDAIDRGDVADALDVLGRMWIVGRHPLQVNAALQRHFARMVALDGSGVTDDRAAAELLGLRGGVFPARKALESCRRRGAGGLRSAMRLLAEADLDLRGRSGLDAKHVAEILCARLAATARR